MSVRRSKMLTKHIQGVTFFVVHHPSIISEASHLSYPCCLCHETNWPFIRHITFTMIRPAIIVLFAVWIADVSGFAVQLPRSVTTQRMPTSISSRGRSWFATPETKCSTGLEGVADFERWFRQSEGSKCDARIQHAILGSGRVRGLAWKGSRQDASGSLASVPRSVVLQADESLPNWDAVLASKLWKEVIQGDGSAMFGYVRLLTKGAFDASSTAAFPSDIPPSTAPNALRHWTAEQRARLSQSAAGQQLLDLDDRQARDWQAKYQQLAPVDRPATFEQFKWAMEVVHSRAFRGMDLKIVSSLPAIFAPVAAGAIGWAYFATTPFLNDVVFVGLGILALIPLLLNLIGGDQKSIVLLPLIDSANHLESVNSSIDFNPLSGAFELTVQPDCIVSEDDGQQQLYISYGAKRDNELLLNYGFLPGVACGDGMDESDRDRQRQELAEAFLSRSQQ